MGRKKRKKGPKPFCYYCNRNFDNEKVLIQHQKAKHFKCPNCHKKMVTAFALMNHMFQVHKESLKKVPNAKKDRDSVDLNIYGMQGVPEDIKRQKAEQEEGAAKKAKLAAAENDSGDETASPHPTPPSAPAPAPAAPPPQALNQPPNSQMFGMQANQGYPTMRPAFPMGRGQMPPHMQMPHMPMGRGMPYNQYGHMNAPPFPGAMPPGMMPGRPMPGSGMPFPPTPAAPNPNVNPNVKPNEPTQPVAPALSTAPPHQQAPEPKKKAPSKVQFVFKEALSMEEVRASLPKYQYNPNEGGKNRLSRLSDSIQARMNALSSGR